MAIVVHEFDPIDTRPYIVDLLAAIWRASGWRVVVVRGPRDFAPADVAINHVDLTRTPASYRALLARYPRVVNGTAIDIAKRRYSTARVRSAGETAGPVIVKTDANHGGVPEALIRAARRGWWPRLAARLERRAVERLPWALTGRFGNNHYPRFERPQDVPWPVWFNPRLLVERFVMPVADGAFHKRRWLFFGARETTIALRCSTYVPGDDSVLSTTLCDPAPEPLRHARRLLGLEYGSADFVIHDGEAIALDLNRTPASAAYAKPFYAAAIRDLAAGLDDMIGPPPHA
ncbi:MAG: hypothetical protein JNL66_11545 [Alphaproteobacteria bacterium]|nr:hypothetical protein [Alphaproteobacteria bacterium]